MPRGQRRQRRTAVPHQLLHPGRGDPKVPTELSQRLPRGIAVDQLTDRPLVPLALLAPGRTSNRHPVPAQPLANRLLAHPGPRGDLRRGDPPGVRRGPPLHPRRVTRPLLWGPGSRTELPHGTLHQLCTHPLAGSHLAHRAPGEVLLHEDGGRLPIHGAILTESSDPSRPFVTARPISPGLLRTRSMSNGSNRANIASLNTRRSDMTTV